jgi:predicted RNA-binding Zn-ribbon protein involved in translation (DUF1610 family)
MPERCLACRTDIPGEGNVCFTCGACYDAKAGGLRGRPRAILIARWVGVASVVVWAVSTLAAHASPNVGVVMSSPLLLTGGVGMVFGAGGYAPRLFIAHLISTTSWLLLCVYAAPALFMALPLSPVMAAMTVLVTAVHYRAFRQPLRQESPLLCSACGYPIIGLRLPRCPECGTVFNPAVLRRLTRGGADGLARLLSADDAPQRSGQARRRVG